MADIFSVSTSAGGGAGTVTTTGSPASGQVALLSGGTSITGDTGFLYSGSGATLAITLGTDIILSRISAGVLATKNSTTAQALRVYATDDGAGNTEYMELRASDAAYWGATYTILSNNKAGSGAIRALVVGSPGAGPSIIFGPSNGVDGQITYAGGYRMIWNNTELAPATNGGYNLGSATLGWKRFFVDYTNTATIGAVTINKASGRVNIALGATSVVVTNSFVTAASHIFCTIAQNDATAILKNVVAASGSFTITTTAATTADCAVDFFVVNAD